MSSAEQTLPPEVDSATASALLSAAAELAEDANLEIEASQVEDINGPAVLAMANIARRLSARGSKVVLNQPTPVIAQAFADLGLTSDFQKMEQRQ